MSSFTSALKDIEDTFGNVLPSEFCVPCFVKGLLEGAAVGALTVAGLAAIAASAPVAATIAAIALAVLGVVGAVKLVSRKNS